MHELMTRRQREGNGLTHKTLIHNDFRRTKGVHAVLIPCSSRKAAPALPGLSALELPSTAQEDVAAEWRRRLETARLCAPRSRAEALYRGRSFVRATKVAKDLGCHCFVISAGLGLVAGTTPIPAYDMTVTDGAAQAIQGRLRGVQFDPARWWESVNGGPFATSLSVLGAADTGSRILIALTRPYADLIGSALAALPATTRDSLRLFGEGLERTLPKALHTYLIPYGRRLDVIDPGTRLDAPVRALEHFARLIADVAGGNCQGDRQLVEDALQGVAAPAVALRQRLDDEAIVGHIRRLGPIPMSKALQRLRRDLGVACEQRRFRHLYEMAIQ